MRQQIISKLNAIEKERNIKILYACESGSRAWGFESVDSDYDVRFVFVRSKEEYLSLETPKSELVFGVVDELDIEGWDIRKSLLLLQKSNRALCEWALSPIVYIDNGFLPTFAELSKKYFLPKVAANHYVGNIKKFVDELDNEVKLKKLFYILRATYAAYYIARYKTNPPMNFGELRSYIKFEAVEDEIDRLLAIKKLSTEGDYGSITNELKNFILDAQEELKEIALNLPSTEKQSTKELDEVFLGLVR